MIVIVTDYVINYNWLNMMFGATSSTSRGIALLGTPKVHGSHVHHNACLAQQLCSAVSLQKQGRKKLWELNPLGLRMT